MGRRFNGTSDLGLFSNPSIATYDKLSISFWLYNDTNGSVERAALCSGAAIGTISGFLFEPRYTTAVASVTMTVSSGGAKFWIDTFPQPSAAAWHHYLWVMDRAVPEHRVWVDGVAQTLTTAVHTAATYGNFSDNTWQLMRYSSGNWFWAGRMADLAVWGGVKFGMAEASELSKYGSSPRRVRPDRLLTYLPLDGTAGNREPVYGRMGDPSPALLALTGTTGVAHPFGQRTLIRPRRKVLVTI